MVDTLVRSEQDIDADLASLSKFGRFWLLTVAAVDVLLVISSMVALNAALPDIALETAATQTQLTWVVDGYTLVLACLLLPAGALGDRYGRRGALLVGLAIFALASLAPTVFDGPVQIIIARAVAGVGAAFIMPATLSLLTAAFPKTERNKAVGIWAGVAGSGAISDSWDRDPVALLVMAVDLLGVRDRRRGLFVLTCTIASSRDETATPVDWVGAVLIGAAVAVFVFGRRRGARARMDPPAVCGSACRRAWRWRSRSRSFNCGADIRCSTSGCSGPDFATGAVGDHVPVPRELRLLLRRHAVHAAGPGLQPTRRPRWLYAGRLPILVLGATIHLYLPKWGCACRSRSACCSSRRGC